MNNNKNTNRTRWSTRRTLSSSSTDVTMKITAAAGQKRSRTTQQSNYLNPNSRKFSLGLLGALVTIILLPTPARGFHLRQPIFCSTLDVESSGRSTPTSWSRPFLHQNRLAALRSTRSPSKAPPSSTNAGGIVVEAMQPLRPESSASQKRRDAVLREAQAATATRTVDSALEGIDAQVLELLSEDFLYPSVGDAQQSSENKNTHLRPYGRPECVPGAMTWASMKKYQQKTRPDESRS